MPHPSACTVILVRHGETEANRKRCFADSPDLPLTETGDRQAHDTARLLANEFRPARVYSSEFLRARQTAAIIGSCLDVGVEVLAGIHDRDFGSLNGSPYERLGELMSDDPGCSPAEASRWSPPGGESLEDVRLRAVKAIETVITRHSREEAIVVCHGAVIQAICAHIRGEWNEADVPPNCGIVRVRSAGQNWEFAALAPVYFFRTNDKLPLRSTTAKAI
jgi:alpha-ribazole phosphatase